MGKPARTADLLSNAVFAFLTLFAILLPHSIKGAQRSWRIALILWLLKLLVDRGRPWRQPLALPLLFFILLSTVSTLLSPDPYVSWDRMKLVTLVLVAVLFAQNVTTLARLRVLAYVAVLSAATAGLFTVWQYTHGIGVEVEELSAADPLFIAGVQAQDIVSRVDGRSVSDPAKLASMLNQPRSSGALRLSVLRGSPVEKLELMVPASELERYAGRSNARILVKGKPERAQGTLGHYVVFAEMLMPLGCLAAALAIVASGWARVGMSASFLCIAAGIVLSETRTALLGLLVGCLVCLILLIRHRVIRIVTAASLLGMTLAALWLILRSRGLSVTSASDTGTAFRLLMWQDGMRLIRTAPWFGIGMDTVRLHWREWNIRGFEQFHVVSHFHSTFLQIAVERGLTTVAAWIWFLIAYGRLLLKLYRNLAERSSTELAIVAAAIGSCVAFILNGLVHYNMGEETLVMEFFFFVGMALATYHLARNAELAQVPGGSS